MTTTRLRLEIDSDGTFSTGLLEWRVYDAGTSANFPPSVEAGTDRVVVLPGRTFLDGSVRDDGKPKPAPALRWSKADGPGTVRFAEPDSAATSARFSAAGEYVLKLTADDGEEKASDTLRVIVDPPPPAAHLACVPTASWRVGAGFWRDRIKNIIVNWIPHCVRKIDDPNLREGGIENFVQAGRKLAGESDARHVGPPFANAWVYNTVESMCLALMVDPQGDSGIADAQAAMRKTLEAWIPTILAAQEPDGYLHTMYTIRGIRRWSNKADHEGYNAGYLIEAAIAHHRMTGGKDARLYDAARRLADLWCETIGPPPKKDWYEGHQAMEMALVKLARYVDAKEGAGKGGKYLDLAKFLLDARRDGSEYDQSHVPVIRQYEAVGHAVRAVYSYAGMADIAMETGDIDYHSAVKSLWWSIVDRKYYVTGGVGSGETSEGFGKDYSLPNRAYCESCAGCGELFFQHRMQLAYADARYADLYEETLYNAVLGAVDLEARNFTYTNPLDSSERRYLWHGCPCCVGNIPRTLLQLPTWMYSRGGADLYVNLFVASDVTVDDVGGTKVRLVQTTDYPWSGKVSIAVDPSAASRFRIRIRAPKRSVSGLYAAAPSSDGIASIAVNGKPAKPALENGYAVIDRTWRAGDRIDLVLPLEVQRVKASEKVAATKGRAALRRGPLIYNIESVDQDVESVLAPDAPLSAKWRGDLLGGVMVIEGTFAGGSSMTAVPNYARLNRGGRSVVWVKDE
ncbi:MAG: glycoside hydrolase family 127 protein [Planctomycetes bacterium]|nr:glycoside hydrolase family 127 protein [Planctomycetota bacterium]